MAIDLATGFNIGSKDVIDERQILTLEQMKNLDESIYPDKYFAICKDDGKLYLFNASNEINAETGKFRVLEGSAGTVDLTGYKKTYTSKGELFVGSSPTSIKDIIEKLEHGEMFLDYTINHTLTWFPVSEAGVFRIIKGRQPSLLDTTVEWFGASGAYAFAVLDESVGVERWVVIRETGESDYTKTFTLKKWNLLAKIKLSSSANTKHILSFSCLNKVPAEGYSYYTFYEDAAVCKYELHFSTPKLTKKLTQFGLTLYEYPMPEGTSDGIKNLSKNIGLYYDEDNLSIYIFIINTTDVNYLEGRYIGSELSIVSLTYTGEGMLEESSTTNNMLNWNDAYGDICAFEDLEYPTIVTLGGEGDGAVDLSGYAKTYTSLADLELTSSATINEVISKLSPGDVFTCSVTSFSSYQTMFPYLDSYDSDAFVFIHRGQTPVMSYAKWYRRDGSSEALAYFNTLTGYIEDWTTFSTEKTYTTLTQLQLTADATITQVVNRMLEGESFRSIVTKFNNYQTMFPYDEEEDQNAYVLIDKLNGNAVYVAWYRIDGTKHYIGHYTNNTLQNWVNYSPASDLSEYTKTYTSLSELGLTEPVSVGEIFNAMVDNTMAMIACEDITVHITDVPTSYGILTIKKNNNSRFSIEYQNSLGGSATNVKRWIGTLKGTDGSDLYWKEIQTEIGVVITSDTITKYGTEILKYPVGTWRIDSVSIGNQFTDLPYTDMAGIIEIDSIQPNRSPYEHAYGYRNYTFKDALTSVVYTRSLNSGNTADTMQRDSGWCTTGSHFYTLSQMYLTANATVQDVIDKLPIGATAVLRTDGFTDWSNLFNGIQYGYLKVEKTVNGLSNIELQEVVSPNRRYFGTQSGGNFDKWQQIHTKKEEDDSYIPNVYDRNANGDMPVVPFDRLANYIAVRSNRGLVSTTETEATYDEDYVGGYVFAGANDILVKDKEMFNKIKVLVHIPGVLRIGIVNENIYEANPRYSTCLVKWLVADFVAFTGMKEYDIADTVLEEGQSIFLECRVGVSSWYLNTGEATQVGAVTYPANSCTTGLRVADTLDSTTNNILFKSQKVNSSSCLIGFGSGMYSIGGKIRDNFRERAYDSGAISSKKDDENLEYFGGLNVGLYRRTKYSDTRVCKCIENGMNSSWVGDDNVTKIYAPYGQERIVGKSVYAFKLDVRSPGNLTIYHLKGKSLDTIQVIDKYTHYVRAVGLQTIHLPFDIKLNSTDEYIGFGGLHCKSTSDNIVRHSCGWQYLSISQATWMTTIDNSAKQFYSIGVSNTVYPEEFTSFETNVNYLNIELICRGEKRSPLEDKYISFTGDSITTYTGFCTTQEGYPTGNPAGDNAVYYPASGKVVNNVDATWWGILARDNRMKILRNDAWSGSRVSSSEGSTDTKCLCGPNRRYYLRNGYAFATNSTYPFGRPEIIVSMIGTNDLSGNVELGEEMFTGITGAEEEYKTILTAFALFCQRIYTEEGKGGAKIVHFLIPRGSELGYANANGVTIADLSLHFERIAKAYGQYFIPLSYFSAIKPGAHKQWSCPTGSMFKNTAGVEFPSGDGLHPNAKGMEAIADGVHRFLCSIM